MESGQGESAAEKQAFFGQNAVPRRSRRKRRFLPLFGSNRLAFLFLHGNGVIQHKGTVQKQHILISEREEASQ